MKARIMVVVMALGLLVLACQPITPQNQQTKQQAAAPAMVSGPDDAVATIDGAKILRSEIEEEVKAQVFDLEDEIYKIKKRKVDELVEGRLLKLEAEKRKITEKELLDAEVENKFSEIPEPELRKFFDENKDRIQGTFEDSRERIQRYLGSMRKGDLRAEFIEKLRKEHQVEILLPKPLRPAYTVPLYPEDPVRGPADAKVTFIAFTDFQCPFCKRSEDTVHEVLKAYEGKLKFVYKSFPLGFHPKGRRASEAALCAKDQGKFWEFHDSIFENVQSLEDTDLSARAEKLGLDMTQFKPCFEERKHRALIDRDIEDGSKVGVRGTPAFFINGKKLSGAQPFAAFKEMIDEELAGR
ncbi:MAG: hypothetical protein A2284_16425 [Deltaproteobacteria bacterium RIFOXYA12_FULL_61_11]|nr:MAG: hypothetical protein A2284_16425 [Deltaproteobacteria bacterium RIFOXYA12_FULL_61_11]